MPNCRFRVRDCSKSSSIGSKIKDELEKIPQFALVPGERAKFLIDVFALPTGEPIITGMRIEKTRLDYFSIGGRSQRASERFYKITKSV